MTSMKGIRRSLKFNFYQISLILILIFYTPFIFANDTASTISSEEIIFQANQDIALEEEILKVSPEEIEVNYIFRNHSDKKIETDIAFPLPPAPTNTEHEVFPAWDEAYHAQRFLSHNPGHSNNNNGYFSTLKGAIQNAPFLNFSRKVDGREYGYFYRVIAKTDEGKDITDLLIKNEIPISATYLSGFQENSPLDKNIELKNKLKKLHLLDASDKPIWRNQTIYHWDQVFEPKKTLSVSHAYRPAFGLYWLSGDNLNTLKDIQVNSKELKLENYCIDEATQKKILAALKLHKNIPVKEIEYILTTANNWRKPIKKFRLEIKIPDNAVVALCWPGKFIQQDGNTLVSELQNFTPTSELKVLFVYQSP